MTHVTGSSIEAMSASSKFPDHFSAVARGYAEFRPHYPEPLFTTLAGLAPVDTTVWDCAAGSGQASVALARHFPRVIATDASAQQVGSAQSHPRVEYRVALAEECGLPDRSVGLVTVAQALHWFDLPRFYAEVDRVLIPGGVLAVWCYGINTVEDPAINALMQGFYAGTLGAYWPPSRLIVEAGYRTLPFPYAEMRLPEFRMETSWTLAQLLGYYSTWSATSRYLAATQKNPLEPLQLALEPLWGGPERTRTVSWPVSLRAGRK